MALFKILLSVLGIAFMPGKTFAQNGWVTVKHGSVKAIPMKNAAVTSDQYNGFQIIDYFPSLMFASKCDSVFSPVNGIVKGVSSPNEEGRVFIKVEDSLFYSLSQLKYVVCTEGEAVKKR